MGRHGGEASKHAASSTLHSGTTRCLNHQEHQGHENIRLTSNQPHAPAPWGDRLPYRICRWPLDLMGVSSGRMTWGRRGRGMGE